MKHGNVLAGIRFWFRGCFYLAAHVRLWKYLLWPLVLNTVIVAVLFFLGWSWLSGHMPDCSVAPPEASSFWGQALGWSREILATLFAWIVVAFSLLVWLVVTVVLFVVAAGIVGSPFYDALSGKIEAMEERPADEAPFSLKTGIAYPLSNALKMALMEGGTALVLFPVNAIPVIGSLVYAGVLCFPLAVNLTTFSTERRYWNFGKTFRFAWRWRWDYLGLGLAAFCSMIPFGLSILTFPVSVAGATLLFVERVDFGINEEGVS
jgi:uncharacterized protein involved in cysteine biosynthesis